MFVGVVASNSMILFATPGVITPGIITPGVITRGIITQG